MGKLNDFIISDPFLNTKFYSPRRINKRSSRDTYVNTYGRLLADLCIGNCMVPLNGRINGDLIGQFTCQTYNGASIVDYIIVSHDLFQSTLSFSIDNITHFSNHSCLSCVINIKTPNISENEMT